MPSSDSPARRRARSYRALTALLLTGLMVCREQPTEPPRASLGNAPSHMMLASEAVLVGASDIGTCTNNNDEATALLLDGIPGTVMAVGDNAYVAGTADEYTNCYDPTWGRHKARTRPAMGQRDTTAGGAGYYGYFGAAAGPAGLGYYSYDIGEWHVIVLNTALPHTATSAQYQWLRADLAANPSRCTVAYWHQPRFFSAGTTGITSSLSAVWGALYEAGVELVVNGNRRFYERFAPQTPVGAADPEFGIRQFIVGTGGAGTNSLGTIRANSEVQQSGTYGVLKLTLGSGTYQWEFVPVAGRTFTDAGSGTCHDRPATVAIPGGPYRSESTVKFDGSHSSDPQREYPLSFAWDFGDGATGTGDRPVHTYAADGEYVVTLVATDAAGNASAAATTTATIGNIAPLVSSTASGWTRPGESITLTGQFSDPGVDDGPWQWSIAWGDGTSDGGTAATQDEPFGATHTYATGGSYAAILSVTDKDGSTGTTRVTVTVAPTASPSVILAAGDISACFNDNDEATARLLDAHEGTVFTLGDNAYPGGAPADYANCYEPTWGRHKARTYAALGNHDYDMGNADATFDYFGSRAGPRGKGYYSMNIGEWHVVVLNDNPPYIEIGDGSEQDRWLQADLAANPSRCTLAIWHQPRFYSPDGITNKRATFWGRLYAAGADLVLNGHEHGYQRFRPLAPDGTPDGATGMRQIIVGTGGEGTGNVPSPIAANTEAISNAYGVLKLTLRSGGYDWEFLPVAGATFTDAGSGDCHGPPGGEQTQTELTSGYDPALYSQPLMLTATVRTASGVVPTGTVTFIRGADCASPAEVLGGPVALSSGRASTTTSSLTVEGSPHTLTACYDGGSAFVASSGSMSQAVAPMPVAISLLGLTHTYDGTPKVASATTSPAGIPVALHYTLDGASVTAPLGAGTYGVTASVTDPNYSGTVTASLTIDRAAQATTFGPLATRRLGDPPFAITARSSAGLPVTFASTSDACAVGAGTLLGDGSTTAQVALTNVGLEARACTISARQPGDANHLAAADVVQAFEVLAHVDAATDVKWDGRSSKIFQVTLLSARRPDGTIGFDPGRANLASMRLTGTKGTTGIALNKNGSPKYSLGDSNGDGIPDLRMDFDAQAVFLGTDLGSRTVTLTGVMNAPDGRPIRGSDVILIKR